MNIIYISQGNIPSKWAHTFQAMKMADALAREVDRLLMVTGGGLFTSKPREIDCSEWYGVGNHFSIVRLPVWWNVHQPLFEGWKYPRFDRIAALYARTRSPDIVYTRSANAGRLCVKGGLDTIIEFHMGIERSELFHIQAVQGSPHLLGVVTISDELKALYVQEGLPEEKIFVWPDAVDTDAFDRLPRKQSLRQSHGLGEDAFVATYCGHLYPGRGVEDIFLSAELLPDVQFLMVGGWKRDIEQRKEEARHLKNVHFKGFVSHNRVPEFLVASDVLLMPYSGKCENVAWMSPLKLFEYMTSGCPIIATDLPALRKHLVHGRNALLIKPDDYQSLADAIKTLMNNKVYAVNLAKSARDDVAPFTWNNRARAILSRFSTNNC
jgi:glycosyltransferase involved in cell wall biosynthesis